MRGTAEFGSERSDAVLLPGREGDVGALRGERPSDAFPDPLRPTGDEDPSSRDLHRERLRPPADAPRPLVLNGA